MRPLRLRARALFLMMLLGATAGHAAATQDARILVASFYQWYLSSPKNFDQGLKRYLAASTYDLYERTKAEEKKTGKLVLDYDPFSGVQVGVYAAGVGAATVHGDTATVPVVLTVGLHKTDNLKRSVRVVVHKIEGTWQLWDFISSGKGEPTIDFRDNVSAALSRK